MEINHMILQRGTIGTYIIEFQRWNEMKACLYQPVFQEIELTNKNNRIERYVDLIEK